MNILNPRLLWHIAALILAVSLITRAENIKQIHPTGYVTDLAGILKPDTKTRLEALCTELEQKTGAQMAIVTVKGLEGEDVQTYANELFQQLGVGKKKEDNGVMLLVAPNDRKYWTEVGYGLEPIINDARAGDAGRLMVPYFRQGDYSSGITVAAWQLAKYIADSKGVTLSGMPQLRQVRHANQDNHLGLWIFLGIIFLISLFSRSGRSGMYRGGGGSGIGTGLLIGSILGSMNRGGRGGWGGGGSWGGGGWGGGGFGGFGGGSSGGGGAGGSW